MRDLDKCTSLVFVFLGHRIPTERPIARHYQIFRRYPEVDA